MPYEAFARLFVPFAVLAISLSSTWYLFRARWLMRRRGEAEIARLLAERGESLDEIRALPAFPARPAIAGLTGASIVYAIRAHGADGAERLYELAFDPLGPVRVKRLAKGVWIPA